MTDDLRPLPIEDTTFRPPEWEELKRDAGQGPVEGNRQVFWDPIHGYIKQTAAKVEVTIAGQDRYLRPY